MENRQPSKNDVLVQKLGNGWIALCYSDISTPVEMARSKKRSEVVDVAVEYAKRHCTKVFTRTKGDNIVLNDKDNMHLVSAISDGGIEQ